MKPFQLHAVLVAGLFAGSLTGVPVSAQDRKVEFTQSGDQLTICFDQQPIASYVFRDDNVLRPYFANVKAPSGVQVTRNHPPQEGDRDDHATMHPGIWLAFGDLSGNDFWRNRAKVEHVGFTHKPTAEDQVGTFVEQKRYVGVDGKTICDEVFRCTIHAQENSYLILFDSTFQSDTSFYFGDQEEMGLGIRVATSISEIGGGQLAVARNRQTAQQIWGKPKSWCDYSGMIHGEWAGITVFCHPANFRRSWMHARDYGLLVANPFGRAAMTKGEPSRVTVEPGETFRLRYAVWIHSDADLPKAQRGYCDYLSMLRKNDEI